MTTQFLTGSGRSMSPLEWVGYRRAVYDCYFHSNRKWDHDGQTRYFNGHLIHYSDFKKAERGEL